MLNDVVNYSMIIKKLIPKTKRYFACLWQKLFGALPILRDKVGVGFWNVVRGSGFFKNDFSGCYGG